MSPPFCLPPPHPSGDKDDLEKTVSIKSEPLQQLDKSLQGALAELLTGGDFEGKQGSATKAIRVAGSSAKYVALLGLGKAEDLAKEAKWGASPYQVCAVCEHGVGVLWGRGATHMGYSAVNLTSGGYLLTASWKVRGEKDAMVGR